MFNQLKFLRLSIFQIHLILALMIFPITAQGHSAGLSTAQGSEENPWTTPVNISNSGSTTSPVIAADSQNIHVVWSDEFAGSVYARLSDGVWSAPAVIEFPFDDYIPVLVAAGDTIHAFWINTEKDNSLTHSQVPASEFGVRSSWSKPQVISEFVADFDAEYQAAGHFNLAYLFTGEDANSQPGVYYTRSGEGGKGWSTPVPLFISRYYRPVTQNNANVDLSAVSENDAEAIYVTWDNRAVKRVYLSKSTDQGVTWSAPFEVDGPTASMSSNSPFNLLVQASQANKVLLVWQSNLQSGLNCTQYYQSSPDGGKTWGDRGRMMEGLVGCAAETKLLPQPGGVLAQIIFQDDVYLTAWDGARWSQPEPQSALYSFIDPATDEAVRFRCRQSTLDASNRLFVAGCDEIGSRDIWVTARKLGPISSWFPQSSLWNEPQLISEGQAVIQNLKGLMDSLGRFHILWVSDDAEGTTAAHNSLHYSVWNNGSLAIPSKILASPERNFDQFSADIDETRNRLILVWKDEDTGEVLFSWADIAKAGSVFEWAVPVSVPLAAPLGQSPAVLAGQDGRIYIAYAIPINVGRGIYLTYSDDGGATWSASTRVFDAEQTNWEIVENPRIDQDRSGTLHLIWNLARYVVSSSLPGEYYSRSFDQGSTWTNAELFVEDISEPGWLIAAGEKNVFRFWFSPNGDKKSLISDFSENSGESWGLAENLTSLGETLLLLDLTVGQDTELNLTQVVKKTDGKFMIKPQFWTGETWAGSENRTLPGDAIQEVTALSSGLAPNGDLAVIYAVSQTDPANPAEETQRLFLVVQKSSAGQPTQTPEAAATAIATAAPTIAAPESPITTTLPTAAAAIVSAAVSTPAAPAATSPLALITTPTRIVTPVPNTEPPKSSIDPIMGLILAGALSLIAVAMFIGIPRIKRKR